MSAVETPPPPEAPTGRRCPRCGATLTPEQEWCLSCGAAVGTEVAAPRGWRVPLAAVGLLLALAAIALILALVELAGPAERVTEAPPTPTPAAPAAGLPTPTASPTLSPEPTAAPAADIAEWPEGKTAWTLVLNSSGTREDAERLANELAAKGVAVGILDSDDFESLGPDSFVVFSGNYPNRAQAEEALGTIRAQAGGGSARKIVPKQP